MVEPIRVLIAESQGPLRKGLCSVLRDAPDIVIVGEAHYGLEAIKKARELKPEVILIDANSDKSSCLKTLSLIGQNIPTAIPVIIADSEEEDDVSRALSCGVRGYLLKSSSTAEIAQALKKAAAGEVVLSPSVAAMLANGLRQNFRAPRFSHREAEVLRLLGEGLKNREIAKRLIVSESTVRTYIYRLLEKLGLKSRLALGIHAGRHLSNFARIGERLKLLEAQPESAIKQGLISVPGGEVATYAPQAEHPRQTPQEGSAPSAPVLPERKLATALSVQLTWSDSAMKTVEADQIEQTINECRDLVAGEIQRYGGTIAWFTSRGLMSFFGVPTSLEHAPQKALHAALAVLEHIKGFSEQLGGRDIKVNARMGINTGAVLVEIDTDGSSTLFKPTGNTTEMATKAREAAEPGAIMVTQGTYKLAHHEFDFEPLGDIEAGEQNERVNIHRLVQVRVRNRKPEKAGLRGLTKFVGRDNEVDVLRKAFSEATSGSSQVVGIVGEAGVGKSRLLLEFARKLSSDKYMYLEGSCRHYGESIAYLPLLQMLRAYFNITGEERESIIKKRINRKIGQLDSDMLKLVPPLQELLGLSVDDEEYRGLEATRRREMIFDAIRDLLLRQGQYEPVILAVEDCQWIDKTSEEFLTYLINSFPSARMMMLLLYRPEYHHAWTAKSYYQHVRLNQLSAKASAELLNSVLGGAADSDLTDLILSKAGGNPLFIEELTRALKENRSIERRDHKYVLAGGSSEIAVPATIQGIIAARLDCLGGDLKGTLQAASVIGRCFSFGLLQIIAGTPQQLRFHLQDLLGLEFIYRNGLDPKSEYVFKHACIQDVVYHSLPLRTKRKLHERIGDAIEQLYPDRLEEFYEILAHHYRNSQNWGKACRYLKLSGDKATRRCTNREALQHYRDAIEVLNKQDINTDRQILELETRLAMNAALGTLNYPDGSLENLQEAECLAKGLGSAKEMAMVKGAMGWYHMVLGSPLLGLKEIESAFDQAQKADDPDLVLPIALNFNMALFAYGDFRRVVELSSRAISLLERTRKESLLKESMFGGPFTNENIYCSFLNLYAGSLGYIGEFEKARAAGQRAISFARQINDPASIGASLHCYAMLFWNQGDGQTAAKYLREGLPYLDKVGNVMTLAACWANLGIAYLLQGDCQTASEYLDKGLEMQRRAGVSVFLANFFWVRGWIQLDRGHAGEARRDLEECLRLALVNKEIPAEGIAKINLGLALAREGISNHRQAEQCIIQGIKIFKQLGLWPWYAQGCLYLGEVYADAGQRHKALKQLKKAQTMFREMGMDYWLRKTEPLLAKLESSGNKAPATT